MKTLTPEQVLDAVNKAVKSGDIEGYYDKQWRYPKEGDDQRTCPLLDVMFQVEYKQGIIIHIPLKEEFK